MVIYSHTDGATCLGLTSGAAIMATTTQRAYVGCLAAYNNGIHHGEWFDLTAYTDGCDLKIAIHEKVLLTSPCPNVVVTCPHCETGRRGFGVAEGKTYKGFYQCDKCDGYGNHPASEECAFFDYDGDGLESFGEYPNVQELLTHVHAVEEHGDAWLAYVAHVGREYATEDDFLDTHMGDCESPKDYFMEQLEESGVLNSLPQELRGYFDYDSYARDQEMSGGYTFVEYNGRYYIFSNAA